MTPSSDDPGFGTLLRRLRITAGFTQEELAERARLSVRGLSYLEGGTVERPRNQTLRVLADALGLAGPTRLEFFEVAHGTTAHEPPVEVESTTLGSPDVIDLPVRQLPPNPSIFVGRVAESAQVRGWLTKRGDESPVIVVTGMAGVGKTAFALRMAHSLARAYPDGQLFLDMRGADARPQDVSVALSRCLRALCGPEQRLPDSCDELAAMYRSVLCGRQCLIVLDNAVRESQIRPLLPAAPGCVTIVTARNRLAGLDDTRQVRLDVLSCDESLELLKRSVGRQMTSEPAAGELVQLCGGLPLGLRLVGARLAKQPQWSVGDTVHRLADRRSRLDALTCGDRSIRAAFDLAYRDLPPPMRRMFALCGLVPGPDFTLAAAAAVAGIEQAQAEALLEGLVDHSLLEYGAVFGRYQMHDLLRLHAAELTLRRFRRIRGDAVTRLFDWYQANTDAAANALAIQLSRLPCQTSTHEGMPAFDHNAALEWLEAERANLVAAVEHAAERGPHAFAWQLADSLRGYFYLRRHLTEWRRCANAGLAAAQAVTGEPGAEAAMHASLGMSYAATNDLGSATAAYMAAAERARIANWREGEAIAYGNLGSIYFQSGEPERAIAHYRLALDINREIGNLNGQAVRLSNLAGVYRELGQLSSTTAYYNEAAEIYRQVGNRHGEAMVLTQVGDAYRLLGRLEEAEQHHLNALAMHRDLGSLAGQVLTLNNLIRVLITSRNHDAALAHANNALDLAEQVGEPRIRCDVINLLAQIRCGLDDLDEADRLFGEAYQAAGAAEFPAGEIEALYGTAGVALRRSSLNEAKRFAAQALSVALTSGNRLAETQISALIRQIEGCQAPDGSA